MVVSSFLALVLLADFVSFSEVAAGGDPADLSAEIMAFYACDQTYDGNNDPQAKNVMGWNKGSASAESLYSVGTGSSTRVHGLNTWSPIQDNYCIFPSNNSSIRMRCSADDGVDCDDTEFTVTGTGELTLGAWFYVTATGVQQMIGKGTGGESSNNTGYRIGYGISGGTSMGFYCDAVAESAKVAGHVTSQWVFIAGVYDGDAGGDTAQAYIMDGTTWDSSATAPCDLGGNAIMFQLGVGSAGIRGADPASAGIEDGRVDNTFFLPSAWSEAKVYHVARCGLDGSACTCADTTTYAGGLGPLNGHTQPAGTSCTNPL